MVTESVNNYINETLNLGKKFIVFYIKENDIIIMHSAKLKYSVVFMCRGQEPKIHTTSYLLPPV